MTTNTDSARLRTDVLVVGAGASGVCAAIAAAREGCDVVLVESGTWIGGMLSAAGVSAIDGNDRLPSGLWGEFRTRMRQHYRRNGTDRLDSGWVSDTLFSPRVAYEVLQQMVGAYRSIRLLCGHDFVAPLWHDERDARCIVGAQFTDGLAVDATQTIFADEYGDALVRSGIRCRYGIERLPEAGKQRDPAATGWPWPQDLTWVVTLRVHLDAASIVAAGADPLEPPFDRLLGEPPVSWQRFFSYGLLPDTTDDRRRDDGRLVMLNWPIFGNDVGGDYLGVGSAANTDTGRAEVLARAQAKTAALVAALQARFGADVVGPAERELYGADSPTPAGFARIPYIREARRHYGVQTLTLKDLVANRGSVLDRYAIAVGDYPLDHHRREPVDDDRTVFPEIELPPVHAFSVPYGALVPARVDGLLVAEKSISVCGLVAGCTRLQPVAMQVGEIAGIAAALCVHTRCQARELDVRLVQHRALAAGLWLRPYADLTHGEPEFAVIQWMAVHGLVGTRHVGAGWANRAFVDPDLPLSPAVCERLTRAALRIGLLPAADIPSGSSRPTLRRLAWCYHLPQQEHLWKPLFLPKFADAT